MIYALYALIGLVVFASGFITGVKCTDISNKKAVERESLKKIIEANIHASVASEN